MATLTDVVRIFVSSKQREFVEERQGIAEIVRSLPLLAVDIAEDWAPGRESIEATYLARVRAAPIYVGLFGCTYSAPTAREYDAANENPYREVLTYVKRCDSVDPELALLIRRFDELRDGHTTKHFDTWSDLKPHFEKHLWAAVHRMISHYLQLAEPAPTPRGDSSVMTARWQRQQRYLLDLGLPVAADTQHARAWAEALRTAVAVKRQGHSD